ncbi:MAG TPA: head GIN domain-containing protein [Chitinophagaceae bacterium]|nr:head GIN domain-containing protein [Chitinophagaceae bacterium]
MKNLLLILFCAIAIPAFSQQTIINDANAEQRNVSAFTGIKVSGGITLYLSQGEEYSLAVSASDADSRSEIKTEVKDNVLTISVSGKHWKHWEGRELRAYVSFKTLDNMEATGACSVFINGTLSTGTLLIRLSGASTMEGKIKAGTISFDLSGASVAKIGGEAENTKIDASGASDIKSYDLTTQNCIARLSGASDARLTISNSVVASASGASTLYFDGNPEKRMIKTSGASSVSQKSE